MVKLLDYRPKRWMNHFDIKSSWTLTGFRNINLIMKNYKYIIFVRNLDYLEMMFKLFLLDLVSRALTDSENKNKRNIILLTRSTFD